MRPSRRLLVLSLAFAPLAFAQEPTSRPDPLLGPGDSIRVTVFQNPDLSLEARISEQGSISYPLLGTITLGGLSIPDAEKKLADALRTGNFVLRPQVSIALLQIRSNQVSILGQVAKPGRYPIEAANTKVSELIAIAGGVLPTGADVLTLTGTRDGKPIKLEIDLPAILQGRRSDLNIDVVNGDILFVDRAPSVYVYGEVQRPGMLRLERDMTVMQALAAAGGLTQRGTQRGVRIHRRDASGSVKVIEPQLTDKVERDDVVQVRESLF